MKIKITYLDHSGFAVKTPDVILVFDYFRDPSHALKKLLDDNRELPVVFLVSHRHKDHFNREIFDLAQNHNRAYVLSNDVNALKVHNDLRVAWMSPGDTVEGLPGNITVKAYGSTDEGNSYLVTTKEGKTIFHAGDLNYWHWQDESTEKEVKEAYGKFVHEMQRIMNEVNSLDIVFFPVDPRLGQGYADGARLFLENINVSYFFPMHFFDDAQAACSFEDYVTDNTTPVCLSEPGRSAEIGYPTK